MSADNGIYILRCPVEDYSRFEYRVIHAQAIENLYWSEERETGDIQPERLLEYFGEAEVLWTREKASARALRMLEDESCVEYGSVEYGIQLIKYEKPFPKTHKDVCMGRKDGCPGCQGCQ